MAPWASCAHCALLSPSLPTPLLPAAPSLPTCSPGGGGVCAAEVAGGQAVPTPLESSPPEPPDVEGGWAAGDEALLGTGRARAECGPTDAPPDRRPQLSALSDVARGPEAGTGLTRAPCRELHGPLSEQEGKQPCSARLSHRLPGPLGGRPVRKPCVLPALSSPDELGSLGPLQMAAGAGAVLSSLPPGLSKVPANVTARLAHGTHTAALSRLPSHPG